MITYNSNLAGDALLSNFKFDGCLWYEKTQSYVYFLDFKKIVTKVQNMIAKYGKEETANKLNEFDRVVYLCMKINVNGWSMLDDGYSIVDSGLSEKLKVLTTYHELGHMKLRFLKVPDVNFNTQDENLANMMGIRLLIEDGILNNENYEDFFTNLYTTKDKNRALFCAPDFIEKFYIDKKDLKDSYCRLWEPSKKMPITFRTE